MEICYLGLFGKTVKVMSQSEASLNLLCINEINPWDWLQTSFAPSLNLNLRSWIFAIARNNWFMVIPERITSNNLFCLLAIIINKLILHDWEKDYLRLYWCLMACVLFTLHDSWNTHFLLKYDSWKLQLESWKTNHESLIEPWYIL